MENQLWSILWSIIGTVGTGLAAWLTTFLVSLLNQKIKDTKLARYSTDLLKIIMSAVQTIFQQFVDTMKKQGTWNDEAAKEAKEKCYNIIINQLTPELKQYIEDNFGDMQTYINNQIESVIYQLKQK